MIGRYGDFICVNCGCKAGVQKWNTRTELDQITQQEADKTELLSEIESILELNIKLINSHNKKNPPWDSIDMEHCHDAGLLINKHKSI